MGYLDWEFSRCIQFCVNPAARDQLRAAPFFNYAPVFKHNDLIETMDSRQPMGRN